jgi:tellurite resistance protein
MATATLSPYSSAQMTCWLRGLLSIAWADGNFDEVERQLVGELTRDELAPCLNVDQFESIAGEELAQGLGDDPRLRENFLRTAVMVAVADGTYSASEDQMLQSFCQALGLDGTVLDSLRITLPNQENVKFTPAVTATALPADGPASSLKPLQPTSVGVDVLKPARAWLDGLDVDDPRLARFLCKMIPAQCPFERDVKLFGKKVVHIPPMCKINPLYEQLVGLRFRSLCYLADDCGEDISQFC